MIQWSLAKVLETVHNRIEGELQRSRETLAHPTTMGDATEASWLELLQTYLPKRYQAERAFVVDSEGAFSQQIDVVIFDRQYSPFILEVDHAKVVPAESVYAVFEAKQSLSLANVRYAQEKVSSVRRLSRTSLPIPHAGGTYSAKPPIPICGGLVTFESDWAPALGESLRVALNESTPDEVLNLGCVARHGVFVLESTSADYRFRQTQKAATAFLFEVIAMLQQSGTVPMIDVRAYARWIDG